MIVSQPRNAGAYLLSEFVDCDFDLLEAGIVRCLLTVGWEVEHFEHRYSGLCIGLDVSNFNNNGYR